MSAKGRTISTPLERSRIGVAAPRLVRFYARVALPIVRIFHRATLDGAINWLVRRQRRRFRFGAGVEVRRHSLRSDGGAAFEVLEIAPPGLPRPAPAVVDYHGGGFFLGHAPLHLRYAERYALEGGCRVFFPDYRLSVDHPFPAGFDDCYATLAWVHANAGTLGIDPKRVVLLGDSAGGALAAGVAQKALDRGEHPVAAQVLIYPVTDAACDNSSWRELGQGYMLSRDWMLWAWECYVPDPAHRGDPLVSPLRAADLAGLPPASVITADHDPLRDEGEAYAARLRDAGVAVTARRYLGVIHGFASLPYATPLANRALGDVAADLRAALAA